jgi:hypothetical protein
MNDDQYQYVDGNAAAGVFAEAFNAELSAVGLTCASCGRAGQFADRHVYGRAPGVVMRCPYCGDVNARLVRTPTDIWLDLHGSSRWRIPVTPRG